MFKSSFTQVVQDGNKMFQSEQEAFDDLAIYNAPSECGEIVSKGIAREWESFFEEHGWTLEELQEEAKRRGLSAHYVYFHANWMY